MTGIEKLREFVAGISPFTVVCGVTRTAYDREHMEEVGVLLRNFLADIADQIEREHAEDREAIAWVREHGGVDELTRMFQDADSRRVELCGALGIGLDKGWSEAMAAMRLRLMPEDCEWPRYESGELVNLGDRYKCWCGKTHVVSSVSVRKGCSVLNASDEAHTFIVSDGPLTSHGKRVKSPAPKVYDADGAEIREGDRVWSTQLDEPHEWIVINPHEYRDDSQTVLVSIGDRTGHAKPNTLTHRRPVLDSDGVPIREGDTVWLTDGSECHVVLSTDEDAIGNIVTEIQAPGLVRVHISPRRLTHERPDSWKRIEEDATLGVNAYRERYGIKKHDGMTWPQLVREDLVRRCRALAEKENRNE